MGRVLILFPFHLSLLPPSPPPPPPTMDLEWSDWVRVRCRCYSEGVIMGEGVSCHVVSSASWVCFREGV